MAAAVRCITGAISSLKHFVHRMAYLPKYDFRQPIPITCCSSHPTGDAILLVLGEEMQFFLLSGQIVWESVGQYVVH